VAEREKTDPRTDQASDVEFDFFDESPTSEAASREGAPPRARRRIPSRPPTPPGGPRTYRLGLLIAGAIILAVILILIVNSCRADQKESEYRGYVQDSGDVATQSEQLGRRLNQSLTTPGIRLEELRNEVEGLSGQQQQILARAQELSPPGPLVAQQEELVETMQLRVNGLDGLGQAFARVAQVQDQEEAGRLLAQQYDRLLASDVVYDDNFKVPAERVLNEQDVTDVVVSDSNFVRNLELASPGAWELIVRRLTTSPEAGGLHGNGIVSVRVRPGGRELTQDGDNTVRASDRLAFQVVVENSGDNQETQVPVTLTIQQNPPIRREQVIELINPGDTEVVTFGDLGPVSFSTRTTLQVNVEPVPGEERTENNTAQYSVIFTLG
jgi:hypothetical protein